MIKRVEHVQTFEAVGDDGRNYVLNVFVEIIDAKTQGDPEAEIPGLKSIKTSDGESVNRVSKGRYQIVSTGVELTADAADAP